MILYISVSWSNNTYHFKNDVFEIDFPKRWMGKKKFIIPYAQIELLVFMKIGVRTGQGHRIKVVFEDKTEKVLYYSSSMKNSEEAELIQEFRDRLGQDKVLDKRYGNIVKVP